MTRTEPCQGSVLLVSRPKQIASVATIHPECLGLTTFHLCPRGQFVVKNVSTMIFDLSTSGNALRADLRPCFAAG